MVDVQWNWVVKNHSQMCRSFHVIFASVVVTADVRNFLISFLEIILLSLVEVILVVVIFISTLVVLMFSSNLENDLLFQIRHIVWIVWIYKHELVIVGHVIELIYFLFSSIHYNLYSILLNKKLWMLMFVEWGQVLMLPIL
jgi:hypothetical protein